MSVSASSAFSKGGPYSSNDLGYNLANTTPELLKFQLHERAKPSMSPAQALKPLLMDTLYNNHLQSIVSNKTVTIEEDTDVSSRDASSGASTPETDASSSWCSLADRESSHLNLRVLIENSVFDVSKVSPKTVLPLLEVKRLKQDIAEKTETRDYLLAKSQITTDFCRSFLSDNANSATDLDPLVILKAFKQTIDLQLQLNIINDDLEALKTKLTNHNAVCMIMGYIEDVKVSNMSSGAALGYNMTSEDASSVQDQSAFESLFSHIASTAVQKRVSLPAFTGEEGSQTLEAKIKWAAQCIDALANSTTPPSTAYTDVTDASFNDDSVVKDHSFLSVSPYKTLNNASSDKVISEYKLALDDLRFSQQYFVKEYEYLKENSLKTILDYRRKITVLEREVSRLQSLQEPDAKITRDTLEAKDREISKLRKDLNSLKIEAIGHKSPRNLANMNFSLLSSLEGQDSGQTSPQGSYGNYGGASTSNAILKKEFKKIVSDMQDQYEIELQEERLKRRELQEQLKGL